jgi:hypothetical protein
MNTAIPCSEQHSSPAFSPAVFSTPMGERGFIDNPNSTLRRERARARGGEGVREEGGRGGGREGEGEGEGARERE